MKTITVIPGDGTGPEITKVVLKVLDNLGVDFNYEIKQAGEEAIKKYATPLPQDTIESIKKNKVALKGPISTPIGTGFRSVNVSLRKLLDLYVCLRPCKLYSGIKNTKFKKTDNENIDLIVIRENTEDLYAGIEFAAGDKDTKYIISYCNEIINKTKEKKELSKFDTTKLIDINSAISLKIISKYASKRIFKFAFEYVKTHNRRKITSITKANIMKYTDGLFLESGREIAKLYPEIEYEEKLVDNMCMQLVQKPQNYDVLVLPNLYGDIISDLCAGLIGGLGIAPGANIGDEYAVFEPVHGSAPKYKGMNKVNPIAMLLSAKLMLEYLNEVTASQKLEKSIQKLITDGNVLTYDLGGNSTTEEVGEEIIRIIKTL